jgi:hypothetical protein
LKGRPALEGVPPSTTVATFLDEKGHKKALGGREAHTPKTPLALEPLVRSTGCIILASFEPVVLYPGGVEMERAPGEVTLLLREITKGNQQAPDRLIPLIYD